MFYIVLDIDNYFYNSCCQLLNECQFVGILYFVWGDVIRLL